MAVIVCLTSNSAHGQLSEADFCLSRVKLEEDRPLGVTLANTLYIARRYQVSPARGQLRANQQPTIHEAQAKV